MNSPPRQPTITNSRGHPREFAQIIAEKSQNFVGREFIFTAISEFIHRYQRGYFTIIGAPGSGKSAILAKYVTQNPDVIYYNAEVDDKNRPEEFLRNICTQLIDITPPQPSEQGRREQDLSGGQKAVPNNVTEGSWFLSVLLQQISDSLEANQKLIIAIDGLHSVNRKLQPPGTNIFYLPRYLPDKVYFLLTRRPFVRENAGLLIETPSQILDLAVYPQQNQQDIQAYIQTYLTPLTPLPYKGRGGQDDLTPLLPYKGRGGENYSPPLVGEGLGERSNFQSWLNHLNINQQEFANYLTTTSENNFMYLSEIINAIAEGFYSETFPNNQLPPRLETYYQQHLQKMISAQLGEEISGAVLKVLAQQTQPISAAKIAEILDTDEYEIEEILENWFEFLHHSPIGEENYYSLYHSSFRHWLASQGQGTGVS